MCGLYFDFYQNKVIVKRYFEIIWEFKFIGFNGFIIIKEL